MKTSSNTLDSFLNRLFAKKEPVAVAKFESMEPRLMLSGSMAENPYEDTFDAKQDEGAGDEYGSNKADEYTGGGEDDEFHGGNGDDVIKGRAGDDELYGDNGKDVIIGNTGDDELHGGNGKDLLLGRKDNDTLWGENGNDILKGGSGDDELYGGNGDDILRGASGNDMLVGDSGDDWMRAGIGSDDSMEGGKGGDYFVFGGNLIKDNIVLSDDVFTADGDAMGNRTTIMDFTSGEDKIVIQNGLIRSQLSVLEGEDTISWAQIKDYGFDDLIIMYTPDGDAVITFMKGEVHNEIVVKGVGENGLTADDFIIHGRTSAKHFMNRTGVYAPAPTPLVP